MLLPKELKFSQHHVWVKVDGDSARLGVTDDLEHSLNGVESVDLPMVGDELELDAPCVSFHLPTGLLDVMAPLSGRVLETNRSVLAHPEKIFASPYADGWLFTMEFDEPEEVDMLMDADEYAYFLEDE